MLILRVRYGTILNQSVFTNKRVLVACNIVVFNENDEVLLIQSKRYAVMRLEWEFVSFWAVEVLICE